MSFAPGDEVVCVGSGDGSEVAKRNYALAEKAGYAFPKVGNHYSDMASGTPRGAVGPACLGMSSGARVAGESRSEETQ